MALTLNTVRDNLETMLKDTSNLTWSEAELALYIQQAVNWCSRGERPKLWTEVEDTSVTSVADIDTYTISLYPFEIWIQDSVGSTTYSLIREFRIFSNQFRLASKHVPSTTGLIFRIKGATKYTSITDVADEFEDIILNYAAHKAMMAIVNELTKFNTYSAKLQNISRNDVRLLGQYYYNIAKEELISNAKPLKPKHMGMGEY